MEQTNEVRNRTAKHIMIRRRKQRYRIIISCLVMAAVFAALFMGVRKLTYRPTDNLKDRDISYKKNSIEKNVDSGLNLSLEEKLRVIQTEAAYPEDLVDFAKKYDQVIDYVYQYPVLKDEETEIDLSAEAESDSIPLLLQWDARWGYSVYGDGLIGYTGCGPTCLSMVALYLTDDAKWSPLAVSDYAAENGYFVSGKGSKWTLISEGCQSLGLSAKQLPLQESVMKKELDEDHPIILVVGPGDFTYSGHFIVVTGYNENGFTINDPNSRENSEKTWSFDTLSGQVKNLWAMSKS